MSDQKPDEYPWDDDAMPPGDEFPEDEEDEREAECGRWNNGKLTPQCRLAGTEWCDWECPIGCQP